MILNLCSYINGKVWFSLNRHVPEIDSLVVNLGLEVDGNCKLQVGIFSFQGGVSFHFLPEILALFPKAVIVTVIQNFLNCSNHFWAYSKFYLPWGKFYLPNQIYIGQLILWGDVGWELFFIIILVIKSHFQNLAPLNLEIWLRNVFFW